MLNEHIIEAIWRTVEDGGDVVIVHRQPKAVLKQLAEDQRNAMRICWVNGNERIDINNGSRIFVISYTGHGRGLTADLLVVPLGITGDRATEVMPILATTQGHLLGY